MRRVARHFPLPANRVSGRLPTCRASYGQSCRGPGVELIAHLGTLDFAAAREKVDRNPGRVPAEAGDGCPLDGSLAVIQLSFEPIALSNQQGHRLAWDQDFAVLFEGDSLTLERGDPTQPGPAFGHELVGGHVWAFRDSRSAMMRGPSSVAWSQVGTPRPEPAPQIHPTGAGQPSLTGPAAWEIAEERKHRKARMDQRTRERLPVLSVLIRVTAERCLAAHWYGSRLTPRRKLMFLGCPSS